MTTIDSGATAIHRTAPSTLARYTVGLHLTAGPVFDWGCGRGYDEKFYHANGIQAWGYDPNHYPLPTPADYAPGLFPWVQSAFVLNVLEPDARVALVKEMFEFVPSGGTLAVAVRTAGEIAQAVRPGWQPMSDGYLTTRNTFQHGFERDELVALLLAAGFQDVDVVKAEPLMVLARKG